MALHSEPFRRHAEFPAENIRHGIGPKSPTRRPIGQPKAWIIAKRLCKLVHPVSIARRNATQTRLQQRRCAVGIFFRQARERIRVRSPKPSLHGILSPRQPQNLQGALGGGPVQVAVESSMEQDLAGLDARATRKTHLGERAREDEGRITLVVVVTRHGYAAGESLYPRHHATEFIARVRAQGGPACRTEATRRQYRTGVPPVA